MSVRQAEVSNRRPVRPAVEKRIKNRQTTDVGGYAFLPNKARALQIALYLATYAMLYIVFERIISDTYDYAGFIFEPVIVKIVEGLCLLAIAAYLLPTQVRRPSDFFLHLHLLLPILPMLMLYGASDMSRAFTYQFYSAYLVVVFGCRYRIFSYVSIGSISHKKIMYGLAAVGGFLVLSIVAFGGLSYWNLDVLKVYEFRDGASDNLPSVFGYLIPIASKAFIPIGVLLSLIHRNYQMTVIYLLLGVGVFGLSAHKGVLLYPMFVVTLYYILRSRASLKLFLFGFLGAIALSLVLFYASGGSTLFDNIIVRRGVIIPGLLNYWYYDFFSENIHVFWSNTKLTFGLIDYQYPLPTAFMMGSEMIGRDDVSLNTGWIGTGYMHAGLFGMYVYASVIAIFLSYIDSAAQYLGRALVTASCLIPLLTMFTSSDLPTTFLNHGALMALLLLSLLSHEGSRLQEHIRYS